MRSMMALMVVAAFAVPAVATETGFEQAQVRVSTADLDLSSAAGQRMLEKRLSLAMTRLCGAPVFQSRDELAHLDACQADAMQAASPQIEAARARRAVAVAANR